MEQTLGHITHGRNLKALLAEQSAVEATWLPIEFRLAGADRFVPGIRDNWSVRASYRARRLLGQTLAHQPQDVLFFHTQVTALFSVALMRRVPSVISLDATPLNFDTVGRSYGHRAAGDGWLDAQKQRLNRAALGAARAVVAWSEWTASSLTADYDVPRERIFVNAPGASKSFFSVGEQRSAVRVPGATIKLLFVGGDFRRKGGDELIEAVRVARTRRPVELHVVTADPVPDAPGVVAHHGVGPNSSELLRLFRESDAFVLPSLGECLSVALMEAAAAGLPIVTTDVGALREVAQDGRTALVVPAGEVRPLVVAIERIVDDEPLRLRLGRGGFALARERFDADRNNRAILQLLASVAGLRAERSVA